MTFVSHYTALTTWRAFSTRRHRNLNFYAWHFILLTVKRLQTKNNLSLRHLLTSSKLSPASKIRKAPFAFAHEKRTAPNHQQEGFPRSFVSFHFFDLFQVGNFVQEVGISDLISSRRKRARKKTFTSSERLDSSCVGNRYIYSLKVFVLYHELQWNCATYICTVSTENLEMRTSHCKKTIRFSLSHSTLTCIACVMWAHFHAFVSQHWELLSLQTNPQKTERQIWKSWESPSFVLLAFSFRRLNLALTCWYCIWH